jgi:hypothetical protein
LEASVESDSADNPVPDTVASEERSHDRTIMDLPAIPLQLTASIHSTVSGLVFEHKGNTESDDNWMDALDSP